MLVVALERVDKIIIKYVDSKLAFRLWKTYCIYKTVEEGYKH